MKENQTRLTILQYNIRKETGTMTALLADTAVQEIDILAIQEPCQNAHNGSSYNPSTSNFHLAHKGGADTRTCFYINKRLNLENWEVDYTSKDVCTIAIQPRQKKNGKKIIEKIKVHNIYNPSPVLITLENPSSLPLAEQKIQEPGEHLLLGDFNLHHPNWNNPNRYSYHKEADALVEFTENRGLELISPHNKPTWKARGQESVIDLVFATPGVKEAINSCGRHQEFYYGSDHIPIYTELDLSIEERAPRARRAWKTADPEKVAQGAEILDASFLEELITTPEEVDTYLDKISKGLEKIVEDTVPWAKPSMKAKTFWGPECKKATEKAQARAKKISEK